MTNDEILQAAKEAGLEFKPLPRDLYTDQPIAIRHRAGGESVVTS